MRQAHRTLGLKRDRQGLGAIGIGRIAVCGGLLLVGLAAGPAGAADRFWDPSGTTAGRGGAGAWDTTSLFWSPNGDGVSGPYTTWNNASVDRAFLGGAAGGIVTLNTAITANSLVFETAGYTLNNNTLTLSGATPTITVNSNVTATINSMLAGTGGLTVAGGNANSTLTLNGANTFSGGINVTGGTLVVNGDAALGNAANGLTMAGGTTLSSTGALNAGRLVTLSGGTVTVSGAGVGSVRYTGAGGLAVQGGVTLNNNNNDYTGQTTTSNGGTVSFTSIGDLGVASSLGAPTTVANGTVGVSAFAGGNGLAVYTGSGNTSNRNWQMTSDGQGQAVLTNSGTGTLTITGNIAASGIVSIQFNAQTADIGLLGIISSSSTQTVLFNGSSAARSITLGGNNTYAGATTIQNVTVKANSLADTGTVSSLGTGTSGGITITNGSLTYVGTGGSSNRAMTLAGSVGLGDSGTGGLTLSGAMTFTGTGNTLTLGGTFAGVSTLSGALTGTTNLAMNGAAGNTWLLTATNNFTGTTTVNGGTLQLGNAQALGLVPQALAVNGGTLDLSGINLTATTLAGTGGSVALNGANLTLNGTTSTSYAGSLTGNGGFVKGGTGTLTLAGQSTYTGNTTVNGGTLKLDFSPAGGATSNILSASSALNMSGGTLNVTGAAGEADTQTFNGSNITAGNNTISATSGGGGSVTVNLGPISHTGGLVNFILPGSGNITTSNATLGGWATVNSTDYAQVVGGNITAFTAYANKDNAATWVGGDVVSDAGGAANTPYFGTVSSNVQLGGLKYTANANSTVTIAAGNTLGVDGTIIVAPSVGSSNQTITGGSLTGAAGGGTLGVLQNGTGNFTISSTITDNGGAVGFTKAGTGLVTLNNNNSYTGVTTVSGGTLSVTSIGNGGTNSAIGASSAASSNLVIESGTLSYNGATATTNRGFTLVNGGASRAIDVAGATNLTFTGLVTSPDDAGLTKTNTGTLTLANGGNNYVGATTVSGGVLSVNTLANGGSVSGIGASSSNSSNLVLGTGGTLQYTGTTASSDRGFTLSGGVGAIDVSNVASILTLSGTALGSGSLNKQGAGALVLSGTNTYTGGTNVSGGTLRAGSTQAFGDPTSNGTTVASGATLDLNGFNNTLTSLSGAGNVTLGAATLTISSNGGSFSGAISGTGGLAKTGGGTQILSGCNSTYTGATTISGSTVLSVDCLANGGQPSAIGASTNASANLVLNSATLKYTGGSVTTDRGITLQGTSAIIVDDGNSSTTSVLEFTGNVVGGGSLIKQGSDTLALSGTNTYSHTTVSAGTLRAGSTQAIGAATMAVASGATLDLNGFSNTVSALFGAGNVTLGSGTLTINGGGGTFSGAISGTGGLTKTGGGTQILTGCNNSYTGATTISGGGTLSVDCLANGGSNSGLGASGAVAGNLVLNNGTLTYTGAGGAAGTTDRSFTLGPSGGTLDASGTGAVTFTGAGPIAFSSANTAQMLTLTGTNTGNNGLAAQITDNGTGKTSLIKAGIGTWILNNANSTYTGVTSINGGVLGVSHLANGGQASSIGASSSAASNLVIGNNSVLRYTGTGDSTDRLFTLAAGTSAIESSGTGAINFTNTAAITYSGSGTRTIGLGGTNTSFNTMGATITDGPGGATTLSKSGTGTWVLTGNNTYTGNTVINDGNLMIGNGGTSGNAGAGNVIVNSATSTLSFNRSDTFNFNGTLSGPGSIAQIGTGTTVLTSASNNIGNTSISAGTLQVNGGLTTATIGMTGTSTLTVNGTVQATGAAPAALTGDGGASTINIAAGGILRANGNLGDGNDTLNLTGTLDTGAGTLNMGAGNDTVVLNDPAVLSGTGVDSGAGTNTLQVNNAAARTLDASQINSFQILIKQNNGTLTLTGNNNFSAGTTIQAGTLQIGNGGASGTLGSGDVLNNGALVFNRTGTLTMTGAISGGGAVNQIGGGTTILSGNNSYTGATTVAAGTLIVNGDQTAATGATTVASGATLGGSGIIGGGVTIANGATLAPGDVGNAPGTLTIKQNLTLNSGSVTNVNFGQANVVGGPLNDHIIVGGNLTLAGTLNVSTTPGGSFSPGLYRVMSYNGILTNNGLAIGTIPSPNFFLQTSVANQVNLVNTSGLTLNFWDGNAGPKNDGVINGGNGVWQNSAGNDNWTTISGSPNAPFTDAAFAVFAGTGGNVTVDNSLGQVSASGMQFAANGYHLSGGSILLAGAPDSVIRVGDGTAAGASFIATIDNVLDGNTRLVKTDLGTLVLNGANTYTGGTAMNGGTVQVSNDANLGAAGAGLSFDGGTLRNTAAMSTARAVTLNGGGGTFQTDGDLSVSTAIGGAGGLTKTGVATLTLTGDGTYTGGTTISAGTLQLGNGGTSGSVLGDIVNNSALAFNRSDTFTLPGAISGTGAVSQIGSGNTVLTGNSTYSGGTTISAGTLQLGNGGTSGSIAGNVLNNAVLAFNRSDSLTFAGLISGTGAVNQIGSGTTILTANNSYTGPTTVSTGTLIVNGDQSAATGPTFVGSGGTLGGIGTIGGSVAVADGAINPGNPGNVPGTLTIQNNLSLASNSTLNYNFGQANVVGGALNDLTIVKGNLTLDGTINVTATAGSSFDAGIYRVISYSGGLTDNGLQTGTIPSPNYFVQTSVANQVNLVNTAGLTLNFWDGNAGPKFNNAVNGGNGVWQNSAGNDNWTTIAGDINAPFTNAAFAIFAATPGTVTVDNSLGQVSASGMQFASNGYHLVGGEIALAGSPSSIIRVGDGTAPGASYVATIDNVLSGNTQLVKTDLGTLVLNGINTYTNGAAINGGTLRISQDANLGAASGGLALDGGTLQNTAEFTSARGVTIGAAGGTFQTDADLTLSSLISGAGSLTKTGNATLVLNGNNAYAGPTTISAGTLIVSGDQSAATGLTTVSNGAILAGTGTLGGSLTVASGGAINPGNIGTPGTLTVNGDLALSSGSVLNYRFGQANVVGGALNDLVNVHGSLTLDGTLNVSVPAGGTFGPGIYRVINYDGSLIDNGLALGTIPASGSFVQTSIAHQVNLVNAVGLTLNYWDGAAGPKFDNVINGGNGVWQNSAGNDNWTNDTGAINAPFTNAAFAIFSAAPGTVTVDNSLGQVMASGMQFASNGYHIVGGEIALAGTPTSTIRVGDGTAAGASFVATIDSVLSGNTQLVKTDLGTLVLNGVNTYTGGTSVNGGTLSISSDANLGAAGTGITLDTGTLQTTADIATDRNVTVPSTGTFLTNAGTTLTLNGTISGAGDVVKDGAGTLLLNGAASNAGATVVASGILRAGAANVLSSASAFTVLGGATLDLNGQSQTVASLGNAGTVSLNGAPGTTLTVTGNYVGAGGLLNVNTALGDDASATDKLVVGGSTSGTSAVKVTNVGGAGAPTNQGIKIIDVAGASNGTFNLLGDYVFQGQQAVVGGAYAYTLQQNTGDGDWYLKSALANPPPATPAGPLYQPGVPLYENYAQVLLGMNEMPSLQQRVGNRYWGGADAMASTNLGTAPTDGSWMQSAWWGRIDGKHADLNPSTTTGSTYKYDQMRFQTGLDGAVLDNERGRLIVGITAQYVQSTANIASFFGNGRIRADGSGVGGTLTWYGNNGFYVDAQAQSMFYHSDIFSALVGTMTHGNQGFGYGFSVESGKRFGIGNGWWLTPQAQLAYSKVSFDSFADRFNALVSIGNADSLLGRAGLSLNHQKTWNNDSGIVRSDVYAIGNVYYEFLNGTKVDVSGTSFASANDRLWGSIGAGGTYSWANGRYAIFGEVSYNASLANSGDSHSYKGTGGFRIVW
ncbi:autotransporter outer membrane beta-barrel domain-containing protein [Bradyrhizobium diazoefficiens]|nr:autotransporter-associated beta strand repeat-containing protein [Bradyrhizobium diazoefficiens]QQO34452.1 autotransporter outer membrane beta-barrel domain-containing protein [Bradyrhizobium diazoefficiens]